MAGNFKSLHYFRGAHLPNPQPARAGAYNGNRVAIPVATAQQSGAYRARPGHPVVQAKMQAPRTQLPNPIAQRAQATRGFAMAPPSHQYRAPIQAKMAPSVPPHANRFAQRAQSAMGRRNLPLSTPSPLLGRPTIQAKMAATPPVGSDRITQRMQVSRPHQASRANLPRYTLQPKMNAISPYQATSGRGVPASPFLINFSRGSVIQRTSTEPTETENRPLSGDKYRAGQNFFTKQNLKYITQDVDRKPTLYFENKGQSGRLRQQHNKGPLIRMEPANRKYFFKDKAKAIEAQAHYSEFTGEGKDMTRRFIGGKFSGFEEKFGEHFTKVPTKGFHQLELHVNEAMNVHNMHLSGGVVRTDMSEFSEDRVNTMYKSMYERTSTIVRGLKPTGASPVHPPALPPKPPALPPPNLPPKPPALPVFRPELHYQDVIPPHEEHKTHPVQQEMHHEHTQTVGHPPHEEHKAQPVQQVQHQSQPRRKLFRNPFRKK